MYYNAHAKTDIRPEFIQEAMKSTENVRPLKLKRSWINWLFRHYELHEGCINFFDEETVPADENGAARPPITWDERMEFNNWQDLFGRGIWGMSQREAENAAKREMNDFRKAGHLAGRCWIGKREWNGQEYLHVYLYGRDIHEFDLHFLFHPKQN